MGCEQSTFGLPRLDHHKVNKFYSVTYLDRYYIGTELFHSIMKSDLRVAKILLNDPHCIVDKTIGYCYYKKRYNYNSYTYSLIAKNLVHWAISNTPTLVYELLDRGAVITEFTLNFFLEHISNNFVYKEINDIVNKIIEGVKNKGYNIRGDTIYSLMKLEKKLGIKNVRELFNIILLDCNYDNDFHRILLDMYNTNNKSYYFERIIEEKIDKLYHPYVNLQGNSLLNLALYNNDINLSNKLIDKIENKKVFTNLNKFGENSIIIAHKMNMTEQLQNIKLKI